MIRITVELWPFGREREKRTLATADIWNDGTGTPTLGHYGYDLRGANGRTMRRGRIGAFKRKRFHVWTLVAGILAETLLTPKAFDSFHHRNAE
jgi:hypothetical protein